MANHPSDILLGKSSKYPEHYDPSLLYPIERSLARAAFSRYQGGFHGADIWNAYEVSWLDQKGKPCVAIAQFVIDANTPYLIESKSFKLYLNSLNQTQFASKIDLTQTIAQDVGHALEGSVDVELMAVDHPVVMASQDDLGICLDGLDIDVAHYTPAADLIQTTQDRVSERLFSHLLKSNCPVTSQPDWATVIIDYTGPKLDRVSLLKYIISFKSRPLPTKSSIYFHKNCIRSKNIAIKKVAINGPKNDLIRNRCSLFIKNE